MFPFDAFGFPYHVFSMFVLGVINFVGIIWAVVDCLSSEREDMEKLIWILVIVFVPFGWLIYLFLGKRQRIME